MAHYMITLARDAITEVFEPECKIERVQWLQDHPDLGEVRAVFVTLTLHGALRGCIGSLLPHRALLDDIIANAKAAAFKDPRFVPLSKDEFEEVSIEISLLGVPYALSYSDEADLKSKIRTGVDGVILRTPTAQATFLPSVWEQLPSFELFFEHLCLKAGLSGSCLQQHPHIQLYQAQKIT